MKPYLLLSAVLLLSGCPGYSDRMADRVTANVSLRNGSICIAYPSQYGDRIIAAEISSASGETVNHAFYENPFIPDGDRCLPTLGYVFKPGIKHSVNYTLDNTRFDMWKIVTVTFEIDPDLPGKIRIER